MRLLICLFILSPICGYSEAFLISSEGSGRATAYLESPKIITFEGRNHVAWLDSPAEGFRICIRTLDHQTNNWSEVYTIGEAEDNHGGPALTVDKEGYLHVLYYSHHHPFRYRRSLRPNDATAWTPYEESGHNLTYPALLCAKDGTLIMTGRRSHDDRPWELEMWTKFPDQKWERQRALLQSRYGDYAQFAASLAWGDDHTTLHLGTRIYETPTGALDALSEPITTVGYMKSLDGGKTWIRSDGAPIELPATAETLDVIVSVRKKEGRVLNAGSIAIGPDGLAYVPYSVRIQDTSQAYLATPYGNGEWRHQHLNPYLPSEVRDWALFMHGGISFGSQGDAVIAAVAMQVERDGIDWGEPSSNLVTFHSQENGEGYKGKLWRKPDSENPRWMPNLERPTGHNQMPEHPSLIFTDGSRGTSLDDKLSNNVWWLSGER